MSQSAKTKIFMKEPRSNPNKDETRNPYVESRSCVEYHDYLASLIRMSMDKTLPYSIRIGAHFSRQRLDSHHFDKCVKPEFKQK